MSFAFSMGRRTMRRSCRCRCKSCPIRYNVSMQFQTIPTQEDFTWSADEPRLIDLSKFIVRPDPLPVIEA